ncbi:conserved hypothetical protein [Gammaproteobacteria bacterium]
MKVISKFIKERLHEASTLRGAVMFVTAVGLTISTQQQDAIVALGLAVSGFIGAFFPDKT